MSGVAPKKPSRATLKLSERVKDIDYTSHGSQREKDSEIARLRELLDEKQKEVDKFRERYFTVSSIGKVKPSIGKKLLKSFLSSHDNDYFPSSFVEVSK